VKITIKECEKFSSRVCAELKRLRLERGLSQQALASMVGLSRGCVQHLESGIRNPSLVVIYGLATAMGVSLEEVIRKAESHDKTMKRGKTRDLRWGKGVPQVGKQTAETAVSRDARKGTATQGKLRNKRG